MGGEGEPRGLRREMGFGERERGLLKEFGHRTDTSSDKSSPHRPGQISTAHICSGPGPVPGTVYRDHWVCLLSLRAHSVRPRWCQPLVPASTSEQDIWGGLRTQERRGRILSWTPGAAASSGPGPSIRQGEAGRVQGGWAARRKRTQVLGPYSSRQESWPDCGCRREN